MRLKVDAKGTAQKIFDQAIPVIRILRIGGKRWKRNVAKGPRIGPWLQAEYEIINEAAWRTRNACLYMVAGSDKVIRYFGISRNGLKHRWRTSPAYDADTMQRLPKNQLFHSQCWKHIEAEAGVGNVRTEYEVRVIAANRLGPLLEKLGPPVSAFAVFKDDGESMVASLERWFCNYRSDSLARWNVAMTS
jgi:hypothetical protein